MYFVTRTSCLLALALIVGCADGGGDDQCDDGIDNDNDGLVDSADPGCAFNGNTESPDPASTQCNDAQDNDADGLTDFPEDPGCENAEDDDEFNEPIPQCRDGIDNDGDMLIDYPNDPGCFAGLANDETDDCPSGPGCPECSNDIDDDADGKTDYPDDPGCDGAADNLEFNADPSVCGSAVNLLPLPSSGIASGMFENGATNVLISPTCGGGGSEVVYTLVLTEARALFLTTDFPETDVDTVLSVRSDCQAANTELGCNDDTTTSVKSTLLVDATPGTYFIIVDARSPGTVGDFKLQVIEYAPEGAACTPGVTECAPGYLCRMLDSSATSETCEVPSCQDGLDNEGDMLVDFPNDPGCANLDDNDETDTCPGAGCPACGNGVDDDGDMLIDYSGGDPGCGSASDDSEPDECIPGVAVTPLPLAGATGTTPPSSNGSKFTPSCHTSTSSTEDVYSYRLNRSLETLTFSTLGSTGDNVLSVRFGDCGSIGAELACANTTSLGEEVTLTAPALGNYYIMVDGDFGSALAYVLNLRGTLAPGAACTAADTQFTCRSGYTCGAMNTCVLTQCNNGTDDDSDGKIDAADPGCTDISDNTENPNPSPLPQCGDGMDNDADGKIDYVGGDPGCINAADDSELDECIPGVIMVPLPLTGVTGFTPASTAGSNFKPSCNGSTTSTEVVHSFRLTQALTELTFSTVGSPNDTVLSVRYGTCGLPAAEIACAQVANTGEEVTISSPTLGDYYVFVDGDYISGIGYVLNVRGKLGLGAACSAGNTQFVCGDGFVCGTGNTCVKTQCNDGLDNDADGKIDAADPGCADITDNTENPNPSPLPECADGADNDMDALIDFPADPGCARASDDSETECMETDPVATITTSSVTGTTTTATHDYLSSCGSTTAQAKDVTYRLVVPGTLTSLVLDMNNTTTDYDSVLHIKQEMCTATDFACNDEAPTETVGQSKISLTNVPAGQYFIIVDGYLTSSAGNYKLDISGVIAAGQACNQAQITAGIFSCASGTTCTGGTCQ